MKCIDISAHQGNVNIKAVRDSGIERIILRAGYGQNNTDKQYVNNASAMVNLGVKGGIYWFSYATDAKKAEKEGLCSVEHAKKYWIKCPIAYDFEYDSVNYCRKNGVAVTKQLSTQFAISFLSQVQKAGYIPVLYLNQDYWKNYFDTDEIKKYVPHLRIWLAKWYTANNKSIVTDLPDSLKKSIDIWQWSSKGSVPGIKGNVDMDEWYDSVELYSESNIVPAIPDIKPNLNIASFQKAVGLTPDGIDNAKTQAARKKLNLKEGSRGEPVKWLQTRLIELGYSLGAIDGIFGKKTRKAVVSFQGQYGLVVDGIAGYNTLTRLFYV